MKKLVMLFTAMFILTIVGCNKPTQKEHFNFNGEYPIKTNIELSYWMSIGADVLATVKSFDETPFAKELVKQTGVKVNYIHPSSGNATEQLNLLLASNDLPDIIEYTWYGFPGGPEKAMKDSHIINLNDVLLNSAPNLSKYLKENSNIDKMVKTSNGSSYVFPMLRNSEKSLVAAGPVIRGDWLEELNMSVPETISEWDTMLRAFKEKKGATAPLTFTNSNFTVTDIFIGAYGISKDFYVDNNGKIQFGPIQPEYKEFLKQFRKWYSENLLDKDIADIDNKILDGKMVSGAAGATVAYAGSGLGKWTTATAGKNFKYIGAKYPTLNKGDTPFTGHRDFEYTTRASAAAITSSCKNVELAASYLDYAYSDKGHILYNFGIEGESFNFVDGYPKYTDLILKNPDGLPTSQAMAKYMRSMGAGPFIQDKRYIEQYYVNKEQTNAIDLWSQTDAKKHRIPPMTPSQQDSSELAKITNSTTPAVDEAYLRFVTGVESIDNFDAYVAKIKALNINRAIEIMQNTYDAFNARK